MNVYQAAWVIFCCYALIWGFTYFAVSVCHEGPGPARPVRWAFIVATVIVGFIGAMVLVMNLARDFFEYLGTIG